MRKATLLVAILTFFAVVVYGGQATGGGQDDKKPKATSKTENPPLKTIAGKISDDGKSFTADKDNKQWTLKNPEDVKGHEGHHVKVQAHVYKDTSELHVMKVTMIGEKGEKGKKGKSGESKKPY